MIFTYPQRVPINDLTKGATRYTLGNTTGNVVSHDPIDELPDDILICIVSLLKEDGKTTVLSKRCRHF